MFSCGNRSVVASFPCLPPLSHVCQHQARYNSIMVLRSAQPLPPERQQQGPWVSPLQGADPAVVSASSQQLVHLSDHRLPLMMRLLAWDLPHIHQQPISKKDASKSLAVCRGQLAPFTTTGSSHTCDTERTHDGVTPGVSRRAAVHHE